MMMMEFEADKKVLERQKQTKKAEERSNEQKEEF